VFARGGDLYAVSLDGSRTVRLTTTRVNETEPATSKDGRQIAFARATGDIWTKSVDGTQERRLTHSGTDGSPAWSPDNRTVYFIRYVSTADGPCGSIFRIGADGRNLKKVAGAPHFNSYELPAISPDGRRIAFDQWNGCSGGTSGPRLRVIDSSGHPTNDLARLAHNGYYPNPEHDSSAWSPDGREIAFLLNGRLSIVNRDGSHVRSVMPASLTIADAHARPAWSADGKWLTVVDQMGDLYLVHPDGSDLRRLVRALWWGDAPAWLPALPK
jgi:Tol biopolymer transport system component